MRGKRLLRQRGERLERPFAYLDETGRMRRVHLRGHTNILKRVLHTAALNLGLLMRTLFGVGTPRRLQGRVAALLCRAWSLIRLLKTLWHEVGPTYRRSRSLGDLLAHGESGPAGLPVEARIVQKRDRRHNGGPVLYRVGFRSGGRRQRVNHPLVALALCSRCPTRYGSF